MHPTRFLAVVLAICLSFISTKAFTQNFTEVKKLLNDFTGIPDIYTGELGRSVAIDGNLAIVGAPQGGIKGNSPSGMAVIYEIDPMTGDWIEIKRILAENATASDFFGWSVYLSGDVAIVGAYQDDDDGNSSGSAYIFAKDQGGADNWGQVTKLTANDAAAADFFGYSVSVSGDVVIVGAHGDDDDGSGSGSAYVFSKDQGGTNNWGQVAKLTATDAAVIDAFGFSVSLNGDLAIVGAYQDDDNGSGSGSAYIFSKDQGGVDNWGQVAKLTANDAAASDFFGQSVTVNGDVAIVGAK